MHDQKEEFNRLYAKYSSRVLAYCIHRGLSLEDAEDVVSDTFLVCWRRFHDVPEEPLPWLLGVARKTMANTRRSAQRRNRLHIRLASIGVVESTHSRFPEPAQAEDDALGQAFHMLGEKGREVILLIALDDLSNSEAAQVLGCTRQTFAVRAFRARSRLKKHLGHIRTQLLSESLGPKAEKS